MFLNNYNKACLLNKRFFLKKKLSNDLLHTLYYNNSITHSRFQKFSQIRFKNQFVVAAQSYFKKNTLFLTKNFKMVFFNRRKFKKFRRFINKVRIKKKFFFFKYNKPRYRLTKAIIKTVGLFLQFIFLLKRQFINFSPLKCFIKQNFNFFFTSVTLFSVFKKAAEFYFLYPTSRHIFKIFTSCRFFFITKRLFLFYFTYSLFNILPPFNTYYKFDVSDFNDTLLINLLVKKKNKKNYFSYSNCFKLPNKRQLFCFCYAPHVTSYNQNLLFFFQVKLLKKKFKRLLKKNKNFIKSRYLKKNKKRFLLKNFLDFQINKKKQLLIKIQSPYKKKNKNFFFVDKQFDILYKKKKYILLKNLLARLKKLMIKNRFYVKTGAVKIFLLKNLMYKNIKTKNYFLLNRSLYKLKLKKIKTFARLFLTVLKRRRVKNKLLFNSIKNKKHHLVSRSIITHKLKKKNFFMFIFYLSAKRHNLKLILRKNPSSLPRANNILYSFELKKIKKFIHLALVAKRL